MTTYTTPYSLPIIEPMVDRIKDGTEVSALAGDINQLANATNAALDAVTGDATTKYGGLPARVAATEVKNAAQDTRMDSYAGNIADLYTKQAIIVGSANDLTVRVAATETKNTAQDAAIIAVDGKAQSVIDRADAGDFDGTNGADGLPGVNAVANDTATASYVQSAISETGAALRAGFIQKRVTDALVSGSSDYVFIKDTSTGSGSLFRFEDSAEHDGSILHIAHRGGTVGTGQAYGINLANYPGAKGGFIGHQYSKASPFMQIDNTDLNAAIYIRNTPNTTQNPGGVQIGDFFQLKPGSEASNRLILKDNLTFWNQTSLDFKVQADNATNYAFGVQTSKDIRALVVTKTGAGTGSAVEVNNAGIQPGIWVKQTGAGNAVYVEGNKPEQFGKAAARFLGNTHAAQFDVNADGGSAMLINKTSTGNGDTVRIVNPGTGPSIDFRNTSAASVAKVNPNGEYENTTPGAGPIIKSPNGTRYRVTATDAGALALAAA